MNVLRLLGVGLITVLFAAVLLAAAPPMTVTNPDTAPYIDSDYHVIPAYTTQWYRLNYAGDHSQLDILLDNGNKNALQFMVHKPAQMEKWWENPSPVGRGNPAKDDLIWSGNSHEGGTWYVELMNYNDKPITYRFETLGKGLLPEKPTVTTAPAVVPAAVPQPTFANTEPAKALPITSEKFVVPANTTLWYSFFYPGDNSQMTMRMIPGTQEKLSFMVHTPSQLAKWWDVKPIGRGSAQKDDLVATLNSNEGGTYYIEVTNDNPYAVGFNFDLFNIPKP